MFNEDKSICDLTNGFPAPIGDEMGGQASTKAFGQVLVDSGKAVNI